jgi:hypothetical protein
MRITLSDQPWRPVPILSHIGELAGVNVDISPDVMPPFDWTGYGGSGPPEGYRIGETEDYYFVPIVRRIEPADLNNDRVVDFTDLAVIAREWLTADEE